MQFSQFPWHALASCAVINADGTTSHVGPMKHWRLPSYIAELWAILEAFGGASTPLVVHTDSLIIVRQFQTLLLLDGRVDPY